MLQQVNSDMRKTLAAHFLLRIVENFLPHAIIPYEVKRGKCTYCKLRRKCEFKKKIKKFYAHFPLIFKMRKVELSPAHSVNCPFFRHFASL